MDKDIAVYEVDMTNLLSVARLLMWRLKIAFSKSKLRGNDDFNCMFNGICMFPMIIAHIESLLKRCLHFLITRLNHAI